MNVREIIKLAAEQSVGLEDLSPEDASLYLKYLNLVHAELYRKLAQINPFAPIAKDTVSAIGGRITLETMPLVVKSLYVPISGNPLVLKPIMHDTILERDPERAMGGMPQYWYFFNQGIEVYPSYEGALKLVCIKDPEMFTIETVEAQIPYPPSYHQVLVDGTCYYLFQGETGLKNKEELGTSLAKWETGKRELYAYLLNLSGTRLISTYSEV